jgi:uncharacterized membrane protein
MGNAVYFLTLLAALGSGIVAGIFFAFSTFIMQALGRIAPPAGIAAMQAINITVINPLFFAAFFGTAIIAALVIVLAIVQGQSVALPWFIAGAVLYIAGCVGVTMVCNVPLNNALAPLAAESAEAAKLWSRYLVDWTWWNSVRTIASALAAIAFIFGLRQL